MAIPVTKEQRYTPRHPCPICGHHGESKDKHCHGFILDGGETCCCSRVSDGSFKSGQTSPGKVFYHRLNGKTVGRGGRHIPPKTTATVQPRKAVTGKTGPKAVAAPKTTACNPATAPVGCTLRTYADAKRLPRDFLRACGLSEITYSKAPAVRIPYHDTISKEVAVRFRVNMSGDRFRWKSGAKPCLYGLNRLPDAKKAGFIIVPEGESDCHTLWHHNLPAAGLPGAAAWNEERDAHQLDGIPKIYVVIEPDSGGESVKKWLATSSIRDRAYLLSLNEHKDPSRLYLNDPAQFRARMDAAMKAAISWHDYELAEREKNRADAWNNCASIAKASNILDLFTRDLERCGVVNEDINGQLLYLAITSRLLDRPVSVAIKGPSSAGKSFTAERTLEFFPQDAYYALSAMSERALAYSKEPLKHRILVIFEAAALHSEFASYLLRSLLSENCVRYETVEKTKDGLTPKLIIREGPTGLLCTSTAVRLHPENETRLLSLTVKDTREQTHAILKSLAMEHERQAVDFSHWHALQVWLATGDCRVSVPFAKELAEKIQPVAVRLRRDFTTLLNFIKAHALLHQAIRTRDGEGRVIATIKDYSAVRALLKDTFSENVELSVPSRIRETVQAVEDLGGGSPHIIKPITIVSVAKQMHLDKSVVLRRVKVAIERGYLKNGETRPGKPYELSIGEPLPVNVEILPDLADCEAVARLQPVATGGATARGPVSIGGTGSGCAVASQNGGISTPPIPLTQTKEKSA